MRLRRRQTEETLPQEHLRIPGAARAAAASGLRACLPCPTWPSGGFLRSCHYLPQPSPRYMKMDPDRRRADPEHRGYLGDLVSAKAMQGDNVARPAHQLGDAPASLVVPIRHENSIGAVSTGRHACSRSEARKKSDFPGTVRGAPDLQDLSHKRGRQPSVTLLVVQGADSRPVFQCFQVGPLMGVFRVGLVAMAHPVCLAEQGFRGFPVENPELGVLVGAQQGFPPGVSLAPRMRSS
jgi:hypothetical protein